MIEGSAIQIHPLVCTAYNADFDGDQMAVHVPLSRLRSWRRGRGCSRLHNLLDPSNGDPIIAPKQEIVLGCYYMTKEMDGAKGEGKVFASAQEALIAYEIELVDLHAKIRASTRRPRHRR